MAGVNLDAAKKRLAQIRKTQEERESRVKTYKLKDGKNIFRMMPPWEGSDTPFAEARYHYNVIPKRAFLCLQLFNEACPICENASALFATKDKDDEAEAKKIVAKSRFVANVYDLAEKASGKVEAFWFGPGVHQDFLEYFDDADYGDFTSPTAGNDIRITKTGAMMQTEYDVKVRPAKTAFAQFDTIKAQITNLQKLVLDDKKPYDILKGILEGTLDGDGKPTTGATPTVEAGVADDFDENPADTAPATTTAEATPAKDDFGDEAPTKETVPLTTGSDPKMDKLRNTIANIKRGTSKAK